MFPYLYKSWKNLLLLLAEKSSISKHRTRKTLTKMLSVNQKKNKRKLRKYTSKLPVYLQGLMGEANLRCARGDLDTSKKMCFEVIRQAPDAYEPYLTLSQMYETTNTKKYKGYLMLASHCAPNNISIYCRLAEVFLQEGNVLEAARCYSRAVRFEPKNTSLHKRRLELFEQNGDTKIIPIVKLTMAKHIPKKEHELILALSMDVAKDYFNQKNYARSIEALRIPLTRIPKHITKDLINMILELLLICGRYSECLDIFTQVCGFTFDVTITEENNLIVNSFIMPENLQVDLKMKFIICLIRLCSTSLIPDLINGILLEDDVEAVGDLYLDVIEALTQSGYPEEALKLLVPLVKSKNFSLAAVWLKYAECLTMCQMPEQAIEAYFTVMALAPSHVEVLYPLAMLLLRQNKRKEALEVLSQDLSTNKIDVAVLLEQMKLLKQINDWASYWRCVELLLSRHCIVLKNSEELKIAITRYTSREKITKIRAMRNFRGDNTDVETNFVSIKEPSVEDEYQIYMGILQLALDRREYSVFQKFAFMGLCSETVSKIFRDLVLKYPNNNLGWNWFAMMVMTPEDIRYVRFLEFFQMKHTKIAEIRGIMTANYELTTGNYTSA
ncbi:hypothetical protein NQ317_001695 [Molorchus minor]|uniref:Tetratricopeptide repeat protein n=1 Tax=Molorchus minor TaxID=1323400 RepID=A0ABQ9J3Z7_9CUCU|nr:hypothetical protein NQ317_001695 [Molorchus minor]